MNYQKILMKTLDHLKTDQLSLTLENGDTHTFGGGGAQTLRSSITVQNPQFYSDIFWGGSIGAAESFIKGHWDSSNLTETIRLFARNMDFADKLESKFDWLLRPLRVVQHGFNKNIKKQAKKNISFHYDLGNDLYLSFLDPAMQYSSAVFTQLDLSLQQAQEEKMRLICEKLKLTPQDNVIEIGTGWGGLAFYIAKNYGSHVTTTTISEEQYDYVYQKIQEENLQDRITLLKKDYRDLHGTYDKLVSIEMIEAVGKEFLPSFVSQCHKLLKPKGTALIQSITIPHKRLKSYSENMDFIQKHIFPGGFLPSLQLLLENFSRESSFELIHQQDIGLDYAQTLKCWREKFEENYETLDHDKYDEKFKKLWLYYFSYCEGGFLERAISASQLLIQKTS